MQESFKPAAINSLHSSTKGSPFQNFISSGKLVAHRPVMQSFKNIFDRGNTQYPGNVMEEEYKPLQRAQSLNINSSGYINSRKINHPSLNYHRPIFQINQGEKNIAKDQIIMPRLPQQLVPVQYQQIREPFVSTSQPKLNNISWKQAFKQQYPQISQPKNQIIQTRVVPYQISQTSNSFFGKAAPVSIVQTNFKPLTTIANTAPQVSLPITVTEPIPVISIRPQIKENQLIKPPTIVYPLQTFKKIEEIPIQYNNKSQPLFQPVQIQQPPFQKKNSLPILKQKSWDQKFIMEKIKQNSFHPIQQEQPYTPAKHQQNKRKSNFKQTEVESKQVNYFAFAHKKTSLHPSSSTVYSFPLTSESMQKKINLSGITNEYYLGGRRCPTKINC